MKYRTDRKGNRISQLGYGCMRFTKKGSSIDYEKAEKEILLAIEGGINYFDTAYMYSGSEETLGRVLDENRCRDKVFIATKLPQFRMKSMKDIEKTFAEELSRLRTDHADYYLMHLMTGIAEWERLRGFGIEQWIAGRLADGSIRNIGFSFHGNTDAFIELLNAYDWDFCQIQYNYLDETSQAGVRGLKAAAEKGIPVIIMEPLRGGKLVKLPDAAMKVLDESGRGYTPAELGLRWLWNQPEVTCVLSGMNSEEMVRENLRIASDMEPGMFTDGDMAHVTGVRDIIRSKEKVGCTGCRYCMPCPKGVDIPGIFHYYNLLYMQDKKGPGRYEFAFNFAMRKDPGYATKCVGCGKCEQHCPQSIPIREKLKEADKDLRPFVYRAAAGIARLVLGK